MYQVVSQTLDAEDTAVSEKDRTCNFPQTFSQKNRNSSKFLLKKKKKKRPEAISIKPAYLCPTSPLLEDAGDEYVINLATGGLKLDYPFLLQQVSLFPWD